MQLPGSHRPGNLSQGKGRRDQRPLTKSEKGRLKALYLVGHDPAMARPGRSGEDLEKPASSRRPGPLHDRDSQNGPCCASGFLLCGKDRHLHQPGAESPEDPSAPISPRESRPDFDIFVELLKLLESRFRERPRRRSLKRSAVSIHIIRGSNTGNSGQGLPFSLSDGFPEGKGKLSAGEWNGRAPMKEQGVPFTIDSVRASLFQSGLTQFEKRRPQHGF